MEATTLRGRPLEQKAEIVRRFAEDALPGFDDGSLRPVVDRVLALAEAATAHRAMESGENVGKLVLRVDCAVHQRELASRPPRVTGPGSWGLGEVAPP